VISDARKRDRHKPERPQSTVVGHVNNGFLARMMHFSPSSVVVWLALANRANNAGKAFPSIDTLQKDTGLARATTIRALRELLEAGEIAKSPRRGRGKVCICYTFRGSSGFEPVQELNQFNGCTTEVVQELNRDGSNSELQAVQNLNPNQTNRTKHKNQTRKRTFKKPSVEEVRAYCVERENQVDPQRFMDYYESNGWKVGKNPMKDWKAAVRTWERNGFSGGNGSGNAKPPGKEPLKFWENAPA